MFYQRIDPVPPTSLAPSIVLVVESGHVLSDLLRDHVSEDVELQSAGDGLEALRLAHTGTFALAIVDADLTSQPDGVETSYWLRRLYDIPVIVISTQGDAAMRLRVAAASPDAFLVRPLVGEELQALVSMVVVQRYAAETDRASHALRFRDFEPEPPRPRGFVELTGREWQVILDVIDTPTAHAVALKRGRSPHTVQNQLKSIFKKLGIRSVPELLSLLLRVSRSPR